MTKHSNPHPFHVIDYARMRKRGTPRMLHRTDCPHTDQGQMFRLATPAELRILPECSDCAAKARG
jgi:hypothetical protein